VPAPAPREEAPPLAVEAVVESEPEPADVEAETEAAAETELDAEPAAVSATPSDEE
jgi:hypothetical protein